MWRKPNVPLLQTSNHLQSRFSKGSLILRGRYSTYSPSSCWFAAWSHPRKTILDPLFAAKQQWLLCVAQPLRNNVLAKAKRGDEDRLNTVCLLLLVWKRGGNGEFVEAVLVAKAQEPVTRACPWLPVCPMVNQWSDLSWTQLGWCSISMKFNCRWSEEINFMEDVCVSLASFYLKCGGLMWARTTKIKENDEFQLILLPSFHV